MAINSSLIQNLIRIGKVSVVFPAEMAVKVVFEDKDNLVSDKIPVLARGSSGNKDYWLPDIGEQVVCLMLPNGHNAGVCIGSYYSKTMPPNKNNQDVRSMTFSDGTYISYNRAKHELEINCTGRIVIKGAMVDINPPEHKFLEKSIEKIK